MENKLSRREARENAFLAAFATTFGDASLAEQVDLSREEGEHPVDTFGETLLTAYQEHAEEIDELITAHLKGWTLNRISRVSRTVLRLALGEMLYEKSIPCSVSINEAVELAKNYGAEGDYQFVNGVLGVIAREKQLTPAEPTTEAEDAPC